jgi:alanyl-tRNA synthetase
VKALRDEVKALRKQLAGGEADTLAANAVDGLVVAEVDGVSRDDLRELAVALRDRPGIRGVVLGTKLSEGGVSIVAAVTPEGELHAGNLIADAAKTVGGGGGKAPDIAVAGGRDPSRLGEALDQARAAAGLPPARRAD